MSTPCIECGYPLNGNETSCPECGCPVENQQTNQVTNSQPQYSTVQNTQSAQVCNVTAPKTDWAQYFYECGVISWGVFKKYCTFSGRASRREYWSFWMLMMMIASVTSGLGVLICLLPWLGVSIRRMHDAGKSGWWCICPFACFFLLFKRSDERANLYGAPNPAKNLL